MQTMYAYVYSWTCVHRYAYGSTTRLLRSSTAVCILVHSHFGSLDKLDVPVDKSKRLLF